MHKATFMYRPACLISQTGGLSTSTPRTALSKSGSATLVDLVSTTAPAHDFPKFRYIRKKMKKQTLINRSVPGREHEIDLDR